MNHGLFYPLRKTLFSFVLRQKRYYRQYDHFIAQKNLAVLSIFKALRDNLPSPRKRVLDFGCGVGYITNFLKAEGAEINGQAIAQARKLYPGRKFHLFKTIPGLVKFGKFDAVTCVNVTEHLFSEDRATLFKTLPRLLKPKGKILFLYSSMYHPLQIVSAFKKFGGTELTDPTHVFCWTQGAFRRLLEESFTVEKEVPGNIQLATLPWGNRFATARLYVCSPKG